MPTAKTGPKRPAAGDEPAEAAGDGSAEVRPLSTCLVPYPPGGDTSPQPPDSLRLVKTLGGIGRDLHGLQVEFDLTGNPFYALLALQTAGEWEVYPPLWALKVVQSRIKLAMAPRGSLDQAFELTARGRGAAKRVDSAREASDRYRARVLWLLVCKTEAAGLSRAAACHAVAEYLARQPEGTDCSPWGFVGFPGFRFGPVRMTGKRLSQILREVEEDSTLDAFRQSSTAAAQEWAKDGGAKLLSVFYPSELPKR